MKVIDIYFFAQLTVILLLFSIIIFMLFQKAYLSFLSFFIPLYLLYCVSCFKYAARGIPLYFTDFVYIFKIFGVVDSDIIIITPYMIVLLLAGIAAFCLLTRVKPASLNVLTRYISIPVCFLLALFLINIFFLHIPKDDFYAEDEPIRVENYIKSLGKQTDNTKHANAMTVGSVDADGMDEGNIKPDVIIILSESFWDITSIKSLELSKDPLPYYRSLQKESIYGQMFTPTFGGGTADVEFEIQTGFINRLTKSTGTAFETNIDKPIMSLATIFKSAGYQASGIHTYSKSMYNRDAVYPYMGYDSFIGIEDINEPEYSGSYAADSVLTDLIIENIEGSEEPHFIFAITMENHQPYNIKKYADNPIKVLNGDMPEQLRESIEAYLTGLNHADIQLSRLIEYLKESQRPTTVLFFGDHQPTLGSDFGLYRYTGAIKNTDKKTASDYQMLLNVPFILWSNYEIKTEYVPVIGTNFMGNYLLNYLGMDKPPFYYFLDEAFNSFHFASRKEILIDSSEKLYGGIPVEYNELLRIYEVAQSNELNNGIAGR